MPKPATSLKAQVVFVTALHVEAKAILNELAMKPFTLPGGLRCWQNEQAALVITGTGKIRSAIGTTTLLRHLMQQNAQRATLAVNFGLCGAKSAEAAEIGTTVLMHRVRDAGSGRNWFPDLLIAHEFAEGPLETHDSVPQGAAIYWYVGHRSSQYDPTRRKGQINGLC